MFRFKLLIHCLINCTLYVWWTTGRSGSY